MIKRTIILLITALSLGAVLAGCSVREDNSPDAGREIRFTASVGTFQVKATDTALETGDAVGLFAYEPVSAANVRMNWNGQQLIPEQPLFWGPYETQTNFRAYYPYKEDMRESSVLCVNADQTTHALFTESDLMLADTFASPQDGVVNFQFRHMLSKVILNIENLTDAEQIAEVYLSNVRGRYSVSLDWTDAYAMDTSSLGTIKAGKVTVNGVEAWAVIVPPQWCNPCLIITTVSGRQYNFTLGSEIYFESGHRYNAHVTIDGDTVSTDFTSDVTEWTDNNDVMFAEVHEWCLIGSFTNWSEDRYFTNEGNGIYTIEFNYFTGDEFKFRRDADWEFNYGIGEYGEAFVAKDGTYALTQGGANISLNADGLWSMTLDTVAETVTFELIREFQWNYAESEEYMLDGNVWKAVDESCTISWYYNPGWNGEFNGPGVGHYLSTYAFTNYYDTNDYWQAQMWIYPSFDFVLDTNTVYSFSCTIFVSRTTPVLVKMYSYGNDTDYCFERGRYTLDGGRYYRITVDEFIPPISAPQCLLFDFGCIQANTRVFIKDICVLPVGVVEEP